MAAKKRGLGRGLDALLGAQEAGATRQEGERLRQLPIEHIQPGRYQPRSAMNEVKLRELADSIQAQGIVQPIVVRRIDDADVPYEIIAGERRWRAAQLAGLAEVPAVIREIPDEAAVAMALIENIQREELSALEESNALMRLIDEFDMTHDQAARAVGRSRAAVSNLLRLNSLEDEVKQFVQARQLDMGHARALLALSAEDQVAAAREVIKKDLSVRATEQLVKRWGQRDQASAAPAKRDPDIERLEAQLSEQLGARVQCKHQSSGKGQMVISYASLDELDGLIERIAGERERR